METSHYLMGLFWVQLLRLDIGLEQSSLKFAFYAHVRLFKLFNAVFMLLLYFCCGRSSCCADPKEKHRRREAGQGQEIMSKTKPNLFSFFFFSDADAGWGWAEAQCVAKRDIRRGKERRRRVEEESGERTFSPVTRHGRTRVWKAL